MLQSLREKRYTTMNNTSCVSLHWTMWMDQGSLREIASERGERGEEGEENREENREEERGVERGKREEKRDKRRERIREREDERYDAYPCFFRITRREHMRLKQDYVRQKIQRTKRHKNNKNNKQYFCQCWRSLQFSYPSFLLFKFPLL